VAPADPEAVLAAVGAAVRTAAGELHDGRPPQAEAAVAVPVLDQLPADAVRVQVHERRPVRGEDDAAAVPAGQPRAVAGGAAGVQGGGQLDGGGLALAAHDDVHGRLPGQDFPGVVGGVDAAVHGEHVREGCLEGAEQRHAGGVGGGGPG